MVTPAPITPARRAAPAIVTSAFSAMLLAANLATPLYAVWARRFGFSTAVLALIFAVYALVLIPALLVFGQLSDRLGRRVVIAIGLCIAIVALVLFALAQAAGLVLLAAGLLALRNRASAPAPSLAAPGRDRTRHPVRTSR